MSAFDATIRVGEVALQPIEDDKGNTYEAHMILGMISLIPIGPGQMAPLPLGALRVPLAKDSLKGLRDEIDKVLEVVKDRPNIQIAGNLSDVEKAAEFQQGLR
jgi:hypothetical protein